MTTATARTNRYSQKVLAEELLSQLIVVNSMGLRAAVVEEFWWQIFLFILFLLLLLLPLLLPLISLIKVIRAWSFGQPGQPGGIRPAMPQSKPKPVCQCISWHK